MKKSIKVALAGNPNVGKTTLLNQAAKTKLKIGNWAGVTVEKKEGFLKYKGYDIHFIDLPGIYTLEPVSEDEWIAYHFIAEENPDVIVNVVETTNAERDLLLTTELLEFEKPMVIALNMSDEAQKKGIYFDTKQISKFLEIPVVKTNGRTGEGVKDLLDAIFETFKNEYRPKPPMYGASLEGVLAKIKEKFNGDINKYTLLKWLGDGHSVNGEVDEFVQDSEKNIRNSINEERYAFVHSFYSRVFKQKNNKGRDFTDRIDKIILHPFLGFFIFLGVMFLLFKVSFDFSTPLMNWVGGFINNFLSPLVLKFLSMLGAASWFKHFFSQAIVGGVGFVVTFLPLIAMIFLLLSILEMSGYMPRTAFIMDRFMHKIGLHGKSMIPLLLGFGCNVPAVMATRSMENKRDKFLVMAMIPFMSCPARLVVFSFFAFIFFSHPAIIIFGLYLLGIIVGLITAFVLRKTVYRGELSHFVMEFPPYRFPRIRTVLQITWVQVKSFLHKAGTVIFAASIVIWLLLNISVNIGNQSNSAAAWIGKAITPILQPIGIKDWRISTSLIPAFLARETVLSSMGTIYSVELPQKNANFQFIPALDQQIKGFGEAVEDAFTSLLTPEIQTLQLDEGDQNLRTIIRSDLTPASATSFMIFLLLYNSCLATVTVMAKEGGKKFALLFLIYSFAVAWVVAFIVYQAGSII